MRSAGDAIRWGSDPQAVHMMAKERLPFSALYVGSMLATLWATFVMRSYILCILASMARALPVPCD